MSRLRCRPRRRRLTLAVLGAIVALVVIGPLLAPHPEDVVVSAPYAAAGDGGSLGTDVLGRDVLSRVLRGGGELLLTAALAAIGGTVLGAVAGLIAAVRRRWLGPQPPEANWALMVRENAQGVLLNPWATAAPSLAIATIAVAVTYACDRHRLRELPL